MIQQETRIGIVTWCVHSSKTHFAREGYEKCNLRWEEGAEEEIVQIETGWQITGEKERGGSDRRPN